MTEVGWTTRFDARQGKGLSHIGNNAGLIMQVLRGREVTTGGWSQPLPSTVPLPILLIFRVNFHLFHLLSIVIPFCFMLGVKVNGTNSLIGGTVLSITNNSIYMPAIKDPNEKYPNVGLCTAGKCRGAAVECTQRGTSLLTDCQQYAPPSWPSSFTLDHTYS